MERNKEKKDMSIALEMASHETVQIEGEAASQILQAYEGVRFDSSGRDIGHQGRSLKRIKDYNLNENPVYAERNIKQQSGFDAELIHEVRVNKENIRNGSQERIRTTDGIGMTNDTQYDHVIVEKNGKVRAGSGSQMKFYGTKEKKDGITYRVIEKLVNDESWERYDGSVDIPSEQFEGAKKYAGKQAENYRKQAEDLRKQGDKEKADFLARKAKKYEVASKKIRKSNVSSSEAIEARMAPELFVTSEFIGDVHKGGVSVAKGAIICSSVISGAQNMYSYASGDKSVGEALLFTMKDTAEAGLVGYGTGVAGTSIKALMHKSGNELIRRCGNTNLPTAIASGIIETSKSIKRYADGEISERRLVEELGEKGVGMMASGYGASVGTMAGYALGTVVPFIGNAAGAFIGGFVGSMVGCAISGTLYEGALYSLKSLELSEERRHIIEAMAQKAIDENNRYIDELNSYLINIQEDFRQDTMQMLDDMQRCILNTDIEGYINSIVTFGNKFGIKMEYETFKEFDDIMNSNLHLVL